MITAGARRRRCGQRSACREAHSEQRSVHSEADGSSRGARFCGGIITVHCASLHSARARLCCAQRSRAGCAPAAVPAPRCATLRAHTGDTARSVAGSEGSPRLRLQRSDAGREISSAVVSFVDHPRAGGADLTAQFQFSYDIAPKMHANRRKNQRKASIGIALAARNRSHAPHSALFALPPRSPGAPLSRCGSGFSRLALARRL